MGEVRVHNTIAATPQAVWDVLSDVGAWSEWNGVMVDGRSEASQGGRISCRVAVGPVWFPVRSRLHAWTPGEALMWGEDRGAVVRILHGFELAPDGAGGTRIDHYERFEGLVGRLVFPLVRGTLTRNYARFLEDLKDRVEGATPAS
jgi:hypothetical protein